MSNRVDSNCDYYQSMTVGTTYNVYSPGYPQNYAAGVDCRWTAVAPRGYRIYLDCSDVDIPVVSMEHNKFNIFTFFFFRVIIVKMIA